MDLFQLYNHLSLLIFAGSLLAILGLRIMTGSPSQQNELIQEFRTSLEDTSRNVSVRLRRGFRRFRPANSMA